MIQKRTSWCSFVSFVFLVSLIIPMPTLDGGEAALYTSPNRRPRPPTANRRLAGSFYGNPDATNSPDNGPGHAPPERLLGLASAASINSRESASDPHCIQSRSTCNGLSSFGDSRTNTDCHVRRRHLPRARRPAAGG